MNRNTLWFRSPATQWSEALPIGNGRLGAMVFGGVAEERVQINEESLWSGSPHCYDNPEAYAHLQEVRDLIRQGDYDTAQGRATALLGVPVYQCAYQPLADLRLTFADASVDVENYRRELDMESGIVKVSYTDGSTAHSREVFASHPQQVLVYRLVSSGPSLLNFTLKLSSPHTGGTTAASDHAVTLSGRLGARPEAPLICSWDQDGLEFVAEARVLLPDGGELTIDGDALVVSGASSATIILSAATSYLTYNDITGDPLAKTQASLAAAEEKTYAELLQNHVDDYSALFCRLELNLDGDPDPALSTTDRLSRANEGHADPILDTQLMQFGRYLIISGSRPGGWPLNLQGIWNQDVSASWGSKYTININIQMNYWAAENGNLSECHQPLFDIIKDLSATGHQTAQTHYHASGWVAHHNTDAWRGTAPVDGSTWGIWPTGGAWFCLHIWEHYLYTRDEGFLSRMFPFMKGAAEFFLDTLIEAEDGHLITSPSISPEHSHKGGVASERSGPTICEGPAMDQQILRDLFAACLKASEVVGDDDGFAEKIAAASGRLAPDKIGRFGQLQEWHDDWDNPEDTHAHVSHLFGLFPSNQINPATPDLYEAARVALEKRKIRGGWPGAWRISLWARLYDAEKAYTSLQNVMGGLRPNLFNGTRVFQIDANLGATAGCIEMLVQSHLSQIHLLPALPKQWRGGRFSGVRVRGGHTVSCEWADGELVEATVVPGFDEECIVRFGDQTTTVNLKAGVLVTLDGALALR